MEPFEDQEHQKNIKMMEDSILILQDTTAQVESLPISTF
jgi:hypothetical protein